MDLDERLMTDGYREVVSGAVDEALREHLSRLQKENQELRDRLRRALEQTPRAPDDLATAVSHSLDTLQSRLGTLNNAVSNFAVREFSLELKVALEVTPLGTLSYRLLRPEENLDAAAVSTVSMSLVPLPKESMAGSWTQPAFTPHLGVEHIQGVGETYRKLLGRHHIYTVGDLLAVGSRVRSSVELAALLDIDRRRLGEWLAHAQLLTVRTIDGRAAEILYRIGVRGLDVLAECEAAELAARYNAEVKRRARKSVTAVRVEQVQEWIDTARAFMGARPAPEAMTPPVEAGRAANTETAATIAPSPPTPDGPYPAG